MRQEVRIPKLGDNIEKADISQVLVKVGETVIVDQALLEIESDKATVELPAPVAGVVQAIQVTDGQTVTIGQVVMEIEVNAVAETIAATEPTTVAAVPAAEVPPVVASPATAHQQLQEVRIPKLGDNIEKADISKVLVKVGERVTVEQALLEIESDKATVELPAPVAGVIQAIQVTDGQTVTIGQVVMAIATTASSATPVVPVPVVPTVHQPFASPHGFTEPLDNNHELAQKTAPIPEVVGYSVPAAPTVRRFAREIGVNINEVRGTGPHGRISKDDVKLHAKKLLTRTYPAPAMAQASLAVPALPDFSQWGTVENQPMNNVRRKTAEHMARAWQQIPHVTQFDQADITELEKFRKALAKKSNGEKLTVTAVLLKIVAAALKKFPKFNASIDVAAEQVVFKHYCHVGVAVDTPQGLLVPVIRDADQKGLRQLSAELNELAEKARAKKLGLEQLQGGTFTITNLGGMGTTYFTPIVNWPEVAILGVGKAQTQPVWQDEQWLPRFLLPLSISYDHRLIDGADAARFLRWVAESLEQPLLLLMD